MIENTFNNNVQKLTYEDFLLKKKNLSDEVKKMEDMISFNNLPKAIGSFFNFPILTSNKNINAKSKTTNKNLNINWWGVLLDIGIGFGLEKIILNFLPKKGIKGKIWSIASAYCMPFIVNKVRKLVNNIAFKPRNRRKAIDITYKE